jgi:hypothetical protein
MLQLNHKEEDDADGVNANIVDDESAEGACDEDDEDGDDNEDDDEDEDEDGDDDSDDEDNVEAAFPCVCSAVRIMLVSPGTSNFSSSPCLLSSTVGSRAALPAEAATSASFSSSSASVSGKPRSAPEKRAQVAAAAPVPCSALADAGASAEADMEDASAPEERPLCADLEACSSSSLIHPKRNEKKPIRCANGDISASRGVCSSMINDMWINICSAPS